MKKILPLLSLIIIAGFFVFVNFAYDSDTTTFYKGTHINNIDVSGMTIEQASNELTKQWNFHQFDFVFNGKEKESIVLSDAGLKYNIENSLTDVIKFPKYINKLKWIFHLRNDFTVAMQSEGSEEFVNRIAKFRICDNSKKEKTKNAYIDLSTTDFNIVSEVIGTETDPVAIERIALSKIASGEFNASINSAEVIKQPTVTADSQQIQKELEYAKKNLSYKIEYDFGTDKKVISPKELNEMASYGGETEINTKSVKKFVSKLADEYNVYGKTYDFTTHNGDVKKIDAVSYGRILDQDKEVKYLESALKNQKSDTHEPEWSQNFYKNATEHNGIGNTYVEIDTGKQHLWCFVDGEKEFDCDVVTGSIGHETHKGIFKVDWKTTDMTLKGTNSDGSRYESFVHYFMPFNVYGEGMHDADGWRSVYGPSVSRYSGSHGCVNMPYKYAKKLYKIVEPGFPVIVY